LVGSVVLGVSDGAGEVVVEGEVCGDGANEVAGGTVVVSTTLRKAPAGTINSGASSAVRTMIDLV